MKYWKSLEGEFKIDLEKFPYWDNYPKEGLHNHNDSKVVEFDFINAYSSYTVKCLINVNYSRYYSSETQLEPEEDDIVEYEIHVDIIKGHDIEGRELNHYELIELEKIIQEKIKLC